MPRPTCCDSRCTCSRLPLLCRSSADGPLGMIRRWPAIATRADPRSERNSRGVFADRQPKLGRLTALGRDRMAKGSPFPLSCCTISSLPRGKPIKLTYSQQFAIIITVTKGLIEEELEEVGVFLFNYLLTRRPPFLLLPCPPLFLSLASWIATFYSPGFVSSPT